MTVGLWPRLAMALGAAVLAALVAATGTAHAALPCAAPGPEDATTSKLLDVSGDLPSSLEGSYLFVPFDVPAGTTAIRVRYCHDQPENLPPNPLPNSPKHVLDISVFEPRAGTGIWPISSFRGGSGSAIRDVTISPNGFSDEATYVAARKEYVSGVTTRGYVPGAIGEGRWAVELGIAAVASRQEGDADGSVEFGVRIETSSDGSWSDDPYAPFPFDAAPANPGPGWYAGDFHVHGEQEPGNATVRETLDYAFAPFGGDGAGLDFVTLLDHNNTAGHGEVGRHQDRYPGKLIARSTEVTTYDGHINNHLGGNTDYRTGPLHIATLTGAGDDRGIAAINPAAPARGPRPASSVFSEIRAAGGLNQINHPTIFPPSVPTFDDFCRGCAWSYDAAGTDYSLVDAVEIATGPAGLHAQPNPGPNPFTPLAIRFWEDGIDSGGRNANRIAAVGSSDSHQAPRRADLGPSDLTTAPIGMATTYVYADELSESGIRAGVIGDHTYVKIWGADGPDLRLTAARPGGGPPAIIGDEVAAGSTTFTATVLNLDQARAARPGLYVLSIVRDGLPFISVPLPPSGNSFELSFPSLGEGRYRLQVDRTLTGVGSVEAVSSPIWLSPGGGGGQPLGPCERAVDGTSGDDRLVGTGRGDLLRGRAGDDTIVGLRGPDCLRGNADADQIRGGAQGDELRGGRDADLVRGMGGRDVLRGGRGGDQLRGGARADRIFGGRGRDELGGGARRDRIIGGRGRDVIRAGAGNDTIDASDGRRDVVRCGTGLDRVEADPIDVLRGCERVV